MALAESAVDSPALWNGMGSVRTGKEEKPKQLGMVCIGDRGLRKEDARPPTLLLFKVEIKNTKNCASA